MIFLREINEKIDEKLQNNDILRNNYELLINSIEERINKTDDILRNNANIDKKDDILIEKYSNIEKKDEIMRNNEKRDDILRNNANIEKKNDNSVEKTSNTEKKDEINSNTEKKDDIFDKNMEFSEGKPFVKQLEPQTFLQRKKKSISVLENKGFFNKEQLEIKININRGTDYSKIFEKTARNRTFHKEKDVKFIEKNEKFIENVKFGGNKQKKSVLLEVLKLKKRDTLQEVQSLNEEISILEKERLFERKNEKNR